MGGGQVNADRERLDIMDKVNEFMNNTEIKKRIKQLQGRGIRLNLDIDEIRSFDPRLAKYIIKRPIEALRMFEDELNQSIRALEQEEKNEKTQVQNSDLNFPKKITTYYVNFKGNIGRNYVTPRGLKSKLVNEMVQVQGIVTKITFVRPRIQTSVHYCEQTKRGLIKNYNDKYNLADQADAEGTGELNNAVPTKDNNDNPLSLEYGYCVYKDSQTITIQEMPENSPPGQLPRSIDVVLENDLVDSCKPGDRVQVTGVFRVMHVGTAGRLRNYLVATGIESLIAEKEKPFMSERDIKEIRKLAKDKDAFNVLAESVAPSIEGHSNVKKAMLLQLLGGREKILNNGTHLRGDINIMMVGDPSTAKSQFLRHIMDIAPLALNTTGRGSSGVGLTAAVGVDKETGDKKLEAGAMVLADRGIICIDEFDKMNDIDRVAIHEVMEQQTVTIAKAGIHTTLNARCSVIAAANPLYSEYARDISVGKNIGLPDSLLSRFDLIFIMLDEKDPEIDRQIAERVITNHRYQSKEGDVSSLFNYMNTDCVIEADLKLDKNANSK